MKKSEIDIVYTDEFQELKDKLEKSKFDNIEITTLNFGNWFARLKFNRNITHSHDIELYIKNFRKYKVCHPQINSAVYLLLDVGFLDKNEKPFGYLY